MNFRVLTFILVLLISSCSQKNGGIETKMSFILGAASIGVEPTITEGMLWGKNHSKNITFGQKIVPGVVFEKELEQGDWSFWVITWPDNNLKGIAKCDFKSVNITPTNGTIDVSFQLKNQNCSNNFGLTVPISSLNFFPNIYLDDCAEGGDSTCHLAGYFSSYKVILSNYENDKKSKGLESVCINTKGGSSGINLPFGNSNTLFHTEIHAFYQADCISSGSFKSYIFPEGLHQEQNQVKKETTTGKYCFNASVGHFSSCEESVEYCSSSESINSWSCSETPIVLENPSAPRLKLTLTSRMVELCQQTGSPFKAGNGSEDRPYILCPPDSSSMYQSLYPSSIFRVANDINYCAFGFAFNNVDGKCVSTDYAVEEYVYAPSYNTSPGQGIQISPATGVSICRRIDDLSVVSESLCVLDETRRRVTLSPAGCAPFNDAQTGDSLNYCYDSGGTTPNLDSTVISCGQGRVEQGASCINVPFSFIVDVDVAGNFALPLSDDPGIRSKYDFYIDWGDGSPTLRLNSVAGSSLSHTYAAAGRYTITIEGTFPAFNGVITGGAKDIRSRIVEVISLGHTSWEDLSRAFHGATYLTDFNSLGQTKDVLNTSYMFSNCSSLNNADFSHLNTSLVTNMSSMFRNVSGLTTLNLSTINTSYVTDMSSMFEGMSSLASLDLSNFNTTNVVNVSNMFKNNSQLEKINLTNWNISNVAQSSNFFLNASPVIEVYCNQGDDGTNLFGTMFGETCLDPDAY